MKNQTTPPPCCLDLSLVSADNERFCWRDVQESMSPRSGEHELPIAVARGWWSCALSGVRQDQFGDTSGNQTGDIDKFLQEMERQLDTELEYGPGWCTFVHLGEQCCCGAYCGMIAECLLATEAARDKRPFYLPRSFAEDGAIMYVSDYAVFIAKWKWDTGIQVKSPVWFMNGICAPVAIAMEYLKDQVCSAQYNNEDSFRFESIAETTFGFCEHLFQQVNLPIDCVAGENPVSVEITPDNIKSAAEAVGLTLSDEEAIVSCTMHITDDAVVVTFPEQEPITVWEKK